MTKLDKTFPTVQKIANVVMHALATSGTLNLLETEEDWSQAKIFIRDEITRFICADDYEGPRQTMMNKKRIDTEVLIDVIYECNANIRDMLKK